MPGGGAGRRQRRRRRLRGRRGQLRAQRDAARHRQQPARVRPAAGVGEPPSSPTNASRGIVADEERCRSYALSSPSIATALNPYIGYEQAAKVVKTALAEGKDLRTVVLEMGLLNEEEVDRALDVLAMTKGGIVG